MKHFVLLLSLLAFSVEFIALIAPKYCDIIVLD